MKSPSEMTILVVDDEEDLRNAIAFDFQRKKFKVVRTWRIGAVAPPALGPDSGLMGPEWGGSVLTVA